MTTQATCFWNNVQGHVFITLQGDNSWFADILLVAHSCRPLSGSIVLPINSRTKLTSAENGFQSPMICTIMSRCLALLSKSMKTTCCHVPSVSLLGMFDGAILSRASIKSCNAPGSYSMVVSAPVEPGQKSVTSPLTSFERLRMDIVIFCCARNGGIYNF